MPKQRNETAPWNQWFYKVGSFEMERCSILTENVQKIGRGRAPLLKPRKMKTIFEIEENPVKTNENEEEAEKAEMTYFFGPKLNDSSFRQPWSSHPRHLSKLDYQNFTCLDSPGAATPCI